MSLWTILRYVTNVEISPNAGDQMSDSHEAQSPNWGNGTKLVVFLIALVILAVLVWRFQPLITMLVVAIVLAYLLNPVIHFLDERTFLSRSASVWIIYLLLGLVVLGGTGAIGVAFVGQFGALLTQLPGLISDAFDLVKGYVTNPQTVIPIGSFRITPHTFDWGSIEEQVMQMINPAITQGTTLIRDIAGGAFNVGGNLLITFFVSVYIAMEMPTYGRQLNSLAQQIGYGEDFERLGHGFNRIWNAYMRGQIALAIIVGVITSIILAILGVQNSLALGMLAGILQVIPYIGSIVAIALTAIVALFQSGNYLGLPPFHYALLVTIVLIVLQNIVANLLLPRVVGVALDLSPFLVILSLLAGWALAGIVGMFLAAPVVATIKLLGRYVLRKLLDQPPFPEPESTPEPPSPPLPRLRDWLSRRLSKAPHQPAVSE